jgi:hypothetical protein
MGVAGRRNGTNVAAGSNKKERISVELIVVSIVQIFCLDHQVCASIPWMDGPSGLAAQLEHRHLAPGQSEPGPAMANPGTRQPGCIFMSEISHLFPLGVSVDFANPIGGFYFFICRPTRSAQNC